MTEKEYDPNAPRLIRQKGITEARQFGVGTLAISAVAVLKATAESLIGAEANQMIEFANLTQSVYRSRPMGRANAELGRLMRLAVVKEFEDRLKSDAPGRRTSGPYRIGEGRIGSAALLTALGNAETIGVSGSDGIIPFVPSKLNAAAEFWQRLNFGTGNKDGHKMDVPTNSHRYTYDTKDGFLAGSVKIPQLKSSYKPVFKNGASFFPNGTDPAHLTRTARLPFESKERSSDILHPFHRGKNKPYKGNVAWQFLNAAYGVFAFNAPGLYRAVFEEETKKARKKATHKNGPFRTAIMALPGSI